MVQWDSPVGCSKPPGCSSKAPLETIQTVLDTLLPKASYIDPEYDNTMIEFSDLKFSLVAWMRWSVSKMFAVLKPRRSLKPKLRTSMMPARQTTTRQAILALDKRNFGVRDAALPVNSTAFAESAFENMMDTYAVIDWRDKLKAMDVIRPTPSAVTDWVKLQNSSTVSNLMKVNWSTVSQQVKEDIADYQFILKKEPKASTEDKPASLYPTVQTVMHHKKHVNAFFGPLVRVADARFRSVLRPEVLYNKGKNLEQIESHLNATYGPSFGNVTVENDFGDYDRSQQRAAHALDRVMLRWLGLDPDDLELWMLGHYKHSNINYSLGMMVYLRYQRKSGDVTTAFGNTVLNMTALAWCLRLERHEVLSAMFLGDDSWMQLQDSPSLRSRVKLCSQRIADEFNGEAKTAFFNYGYFCGYFVFEVNGEVKMAADPVKRAVKLGRWDIKSTDVLHEHWVSFGDIMRNYEREDVQERLAKACLERYPRGSEAGVKSLIEALYAIKLSFKQFRGLWDSAVSTTEY